MAWGSAFASPPLRARRAGIWVSASRSNWAGCGWRLPAQKGPLTLLPPLPPSGVRTQDPQLPPNTACPPGVCAPGWSLGPLLGSRVDPRAPPPLDALPLTPKWTRCSLSWFCLLGWSLPNYSLSIWGTGLSLLPPSFQTLRTASGRLWTLRLGSLNLTHAVSDTNLGCFPIFSPVSLLRSNHSPHTLEPFMHPALVSEPPSSFCWSVMLSLEVLVGFRIDLFVG